MNDVDVIVVGAGMAGASIAAEIAGRASVLVLEAESQPGYHSTGRSAAFWTESYGGPQVQPLTTASHGFLDQPPASFSDCGFLTKRGALNIAREGEGARIDRFAAAFADTSVRTERLDRDALRRAVPWLSRTYDAAVAEPDCCDIDVAGLHQAYLRAVRRQGGAVRTGARVEAVEPDPDGWTVRVGNGSLRAGAIVNAAGAWADGVAEMAGLEPLGIAPFRRTIVQVTTTSTIDPAGPLVIALDGSFYFKPESDRSLWLSPHDEVPDAPGDVAPTEMDVAIAVDRFEAATSLKVANVARKWAGLRSFAPDRLPVYGYDTRRAGFFWFVGQGGFGIQTAPAAAKLGAALLLDKPPPASVADIDAATYTPARFG